jgi:hypothetical protein
MAASVPCMQPYRVPFDFDRASAPRFRVRNRSPETLRGVTATLLGSGVMPAQLPRLLRPGEQLELVIRGDDLARETALVIRWIRPDGEEYLWRVAF